MTEICKHCETEITLHFCPNCGEPSKVKRIDGHYILNEIAQVLNFERGILYTIKGLVLRPGQTIRNYINEDRARLVKPVLFLIITSLFYSIINTFFLLEDTYIKTSGTLPSATSAIVMWVQNHYGYANIIMGVFIALWTKLLFSKDKFNFFEILILLCFTMGIGMLIYSFFALFQGLTQIDSMQIAGIVGIIYLTWAIGQFFNQQKAIIYVKAFVAYLLGMLSFTIVTIGLGLSIDFLKAYL